MKVFRNIIRDFILSANHRIWVSPYLKDKGIIYAGWIEHPDTNELKSLGVQGLMRRHYDGSCVNQCIVTKRVKDKLESKNINLKGLTGYNKYGKEVAWRGEDI